MFDPLEQFALITVFFNTLSLGFGSFKFYWATNYSWMLGFLLCWICGLYFLVLRTRQSALQALPLRVYNLLAQFYGEIVFNNFPQMAYYFFPYIMFLFTFLLFANLFGLIPYSFAITSNIIVTLCFSSVTFFASILIGFYTHGVRFFGLFLPSGAPLGLIPLLVGLELISFVARLFSLAIRLFANIMSGHTLLNILANFSWLLWVGVSFVFCGPAFIVFLVSFMEIGISALQAYVFAVLSSIYIYEAIALH
jgi:ATP synthase subunit 6